MKLWLRRHWLAVLVIAMFGIGLGPWCLGSASFIESCGHKKYEPYELFNDEEMREHVFSGCKFGEKLQCSESWGNSGCSKTHWTTCVCVETAKDHEAPRY